MIYESGVVNQSRRHSGVKAFDSVCINLTLTRSLRSSTPLLLGIKHRPRA